jgi:hypothetical protein
MTIAGAGRKKRTANVRSSVRRLAIVKFNAGVAAVLCTDRLG